MRHQLVKNGWYEKLPSHEKVIFEESVRTVLNDIKNEETVKAFQEIVLIASRNKIRLQVLSNVPKDYS